MSRSKKLGMLVIALTIVSTAAFAAVKLGDSTYSSDEEGESIFSVNSDDVTSISWEYSDETLSFTNDEEGWIYDEDSRFPLDEGYIQTILTNLSDIVSYKTIEDPEDLEQYGLDNPVCDISVKTSETFNILIGSESSMGERRYVSIGDGNVYLVDSSLLDSFAYSLNDLIEKEEIPSMVNVNSFSVKTDDTRLDIVYKEDSGLAYSDSYLWFLEEDGKYTTLDTELTNELLDTVAYMNWGDCIDYKAEENLSTYGLEDPAAVMSINYIDTVEVDTGETDEDGQPVYETQEKDAVFTLEIGDYVGDYCYARIAGSDMVYMIDASIADALLDADMDSLLPDEVILLDWDKVNKVNITIDEETYLIEKKEKSVENSDGNTTTETVWEMNGEETDVEELWDTLDAMAAGGSKKDPSYAEDPVISFVFSQDSENFPEVTLEFYQYDSSDCIVCLNGEARLLVSRDSVDSLVESVEELE